MKLIVGLGNPGDRYQPTRHNAGFWLVERYAAMTGTMLRKDAKFQALVGRHDAGGAWLVLPQNFMNASGRPVHMLASFFKIAPADILVAHDELDFPPGTVRLKQGGSAGGHNGLKDISARLGSHDYWRLRIGIGHPGDRNAVTEYVLNKPAQAERAEIEAAIGRALEVLPLAVAGDLQGAMLKLHTSPEPAARPAKPAKERKPEQPADSQKSQKAEQAAAASPGISAKVPEPKVADPEAAADAGTADKRRLGSFFKKFMPDSDPGRKK
jgi:PTH1 family peptidyl-tRNA hydrolase